MAFTIPFSVLDFDFAKSKLAHKWQLIIKVFSL